MSDLLVRNEILEDRRIPLQGEMVLVGRDEQVHVQLENRGISRFHARLEAQPDGGWIVVDLGSSNGTFVNDARVDAPVPLEPGDRLRFGPVHCELVGEPAPPAAPPERPVVAPTAPPPSGPEPPNVARWITIACSVAVIIGVAVAMTNLVGRGQDSEEDAEAEETEAPPPPRPTPLRPQPAVTPPAPQPPQPSPKERDDPPSTPVPPTPTEDLAVVVLKDGRTVTGRRLEPEDPVWVRIVPQGSGLPELFPREQVASVDGVPLATDLPAIFDARRKLAGKRADRLMELADWCGRVGLAERRKEVAKAITEIEPEHAAAWALLGRFRYRGDWAERGALEKTGAVDAEGRLVGTARDVRQIRSLYLDCLGRPPRRRELREALAVSPRTVVQRLFAGVEAWSWWLEDLAARLVGPHAVPALAGRIKEMAESLSFGEENVRQAYRLLLDSDALRVASSDDPTYVRTVIGEVLGPTAARDAGFVEKSVKMVQGQRVALFGERGESREEFVDIVLRQPTFYKRLAHREALRFLGKELTRRELARASIRLAASPESFQQLRQRWLVPSEDAPLRAPRPLSEGQFLRSVYVDALGRLPGPDEMQRLHEVARGLPGPGSRTAIAGLLCRSPRLQVPAVDDPQKAAWVADRFRLMLGRHPTGAEFTACTAADVSPRDVLRYLFSRPEYQSY